MICITMLYNILQRFQLNREKEPYLIKIANRIFTSIKTRKT